MSTFLLPVTVLRRRLDEGEVIQIPFLGLPGGWIRFWASYLRYPIPLGVLVDVISSWLECFLLLPHLSLST